MVHTDPPRPLRLCGHIHARARVNDPRGGVRNIVKTLQPPSPCAVASHRRPLQQPFLCVCRHGHCTRKHACDDPKAAPKCASARLHTRQRQRVIRVCNTSASTGSGGCVSHIHHRVCGHASQQTPPSSLSRALESKPRRHGAHTGGCDVASASVRGRWHPQQHG